MTVQREKVLDELAGVGARLLRAQQAPLGKDGSLRNVVLTFDLARLIVGTSEEQEGIQVWIDPGNAAVELPENLLEADEEEPWWRVLGNPLERAWAHSDPQGGPLLLELQFRADHANPRFVTLELSNGGLRVRLRPPEAARPDAH